MPATPPEFTPSPVAGRRFRLFLFAAALGLAACGSDGDPVDASAATTIEEDSSVEAEDVAEDDHDDEDHDDEDHDDEDHDDEDHDEEHDDEEHDDEEHDDHDDEGGLGAHEHGTAEMTVAWIDADVTVDLISPNINVFGFEYEPETDEDLAVEADRLAALTADGVIQVNDGAGCTLTDSPTTEIERDGTHSEITVSWIFTCENADDVEQVDASALFAEFPGFEDIDVQWLSASSQGSVELTPDASTVDLDG